MKAARIRRHRSGVSTIGSQDFAVSPDGTVSEFSPQKRHCKPVSAQQLAERVVEQRDMIMKQHRKLVEVEEKRAQAAQVAYHLKHKLEELQKASLAEMTPTQLARFLLPHDKWTALAARVGGAATAPAGAFMAVDAVLAHLVSRVTIYAKDPTLGVLRHLRSQPTFQRLLTAGLHSIVAVEAAVR